MGKFIDLTGQTFGRLTVVEIKSRASRRTNLPTIWLCRCRCGRGVGVRAANLAKTKSCGCIGRELTSQRNKARTIVIPNGTRFGRLTVTKYLGVLNTHATFEVVCDCGKNHQASGSCLRSGSTQSCGCLAQENRSAIGKSQRRHGHTWRQNGEAGNSSEYGAYRAAKQRCLNPNNQFWADYGGRGIEFRFQSFEEFIEHIGLKPSSDLELDRIDNDGHYEVGNVRWASHSTQMANRRPYHWGATKRKRAALA
jgi:hypothetical protein